MTGKVGAEVSAEEAQTAAKLIALNLLSSLKKEVGDLDKVGYGGWVGGWMEEGRTACKAECSEPTLFPEEGGGREEGGRERMTKAIHPPTIYLPYP